jgi:hypothetical protein
MLWFTPAEILPCVQCLRRGSTRARLPRKGVVDCRSVVEIVESDRAPEKSAVISMRKPDERRQRCHPPMIRTLLSLSLGRVRIVPVKPESTAIGTIRKTRSAQCRGWPRCAVAVPDSAHRSHPPSAFSCHPPSDKTPPGSLNVRALIFPTTSSTVAIDRIAKQRIKMR